MLIFICILFVLFLFYIFTITPNLSRKGQLKMFQSMQFAHRGYFSKDKSIPENSMPAIQAAIDNHLAIEIDLHLTKDKQVVVFHDDTLLRMCGQNVAIWNLAYLELQQYTLQETQERIPLLEEVLALVDGQVPLLIELKLPMNNTSLCDYTYHILKDYPGVFLIQSFNSLALRWFKQHAPLVLRGQLSSNLTSNKEKNSFFFRFLVRFLMTNWFCKPDFISYKLKDTKNVSLLLNQHLFHVPIAVWTIRSEVDHLYAKAHFDMVIFENFNI